VPPLAGLRVIDLTRVVAGPYCTMLLGDLGAEVIKIEEPVSGDDARGWGPFAGEWGSYFLQLNRNKKSITVNLQSSAGAEVLRRLIVSSDVLVENFRPDGLANLGFGYEAARELNPALIYCSISAYGQTGSRKSISGYDAVIQAESGLMDMTGFPDGIPVCIPVPVSDYIAGLYAHIGILAALQDRANSGLGQFVDIALFDALFSIMGWPIGRYKLTSKPPERTGNDSPGVAPYGAFRTGDTMVMIAVPNEGLWRKLCEGIGARHLVDDPRFVTNADRIRNRAAMKAELEGIFEAFTADRLCDLMKQARVPCGKVRSLPEVLQDPQVAVRGMLQSLDALELKDFKVVGNPVKLSRTPAQFKLAPPRLGEHTEAVLKELGYTEAEVGDILRQQAEVIEQKNYRESFTDPGG
jgi:crotonobetainyl-CoA:carnitine CoA-transferase CaiB-like acyl-CoA transferase